MTDWTLWTARLAMLLYAAALACWASGTRLAIGRWLYTGGAIIFVLHVAAAFHFRHHWSHAEALDNVRRQTLAFTGVASGAGLWLNYLFTLVWVGDAAWWWIAGDDHYRRRSRWITLAVHGFLLFMAFNATVIFPTGPTRTAGIIIALLLAMLWLIRLGCGRNRSAFDGLSR